MKFNKEIKKVSTLRKVLAYKFLKEGEKPVFKASQDGAGYTIPHQGCSAVKVEFTKGRRVEVLTYDRIVFKEVSAMDARTKSQIKKIERDLLNGAVIMEDSILVELFNKSISDETYEGKTIKDIVEAFSFIEKRSVPASIIIGSSNVKSFCDYMKSFQVKLNFSSAGKISCKYKGKSISVYVSEKDILNNNVYILGKAEDVGMLYEYMEFVPMSIENPKKGTSEFAFITNSGQFIKDINTIVKIDLSKNK